jgi:hypothetical protein
MTTTLAAQLRIHGKIPVVRSIRRSYAMQVRDNAFVKLQALKFFQGFTFKRSHALKVMPNMMPYCSVYFLSEALAPDGDADIGEVRFQSTVRLGFSVMLVNNDPDMMEDRLDDAYQSIMDGLLRDPTFVRTAPWGQTSPGYVIQAFARGGRQHFYGITGVQNNETPYAEMRAELHCSLGAIEYEPYVENMLEIIHVETVHPPGDTDNQHIFSIYDLDQQQGDE